MFSFWDPFSFQFEPIGSVHGGHAGGVNNKNILDENETFSQRKIVLLFYSSNMAAGHILYKLVSNNVSKD